MLPRQMKLDLRSKKDFFKTCKKKHSQFFSFFYKKNNQEGLKVSVIVPKKLLNLATKRIEVKRKVNNCLGKLSLEQKNKNIDLALVVNKKMIDLEQNRLLKIIESSLIEITV
jgi:ribonuclease P protein component